MENELIVQEVLKRLDATASTVGSAASAGFAEAVRYTAVSSAFYAAMSLVLAIAACIVARKLFALGAAEKHDGEGYLVVGALIAAGGVGATVAIFVNLGIALAPKGYLVMKIIEGAKD